MFKYTFVSIIFISFLFVLANIQLDAFKFKTPVERVYSDFSYEETFTKLKGKETFCKKSLHNNVIHIECKEDSDIAKFNSHCTLGEDKMYECQYQGTINNKSIDGKTKINLSNAFI